MLIWIVAHSQSLCNFVVPCYSSFQSRSSHALNFIEAVPVSPAKHKPLAALTRLLWLPHADHFALAWQIIERARRAADEKSEDSTPSPHQENRLLSFLPGSGAAINASPTKNALTP